MPATVIEPTIVNVTVPGLPGPPGPPGAAGAQTATLVAARDLSGHRAVAATASGADYADPDTPAHAGAVLGITTGAVLDGEQATIQTAGEMTEPSWTWTPGQTLYVGAMGQLASAPPTTGWVRPIATAITATRILIIDHPPIHQ